MKLHSREYHCTLLMISDYRVTTMTTLGFQWRTGRYTDGTFRWEPDCLFTRPAVPSENRTGDAYEVSDNRCASVWDISMVLNSILVWREWPLPLSMTTMHTIWFPGRIPLIDESLGIPIGATWLLSKQISLVMVVNGFVPSSQNSTCFAQIPLDSRQNISCFRWYFFH